MNRKESVWGCDTFAYMSNSSVLSEMMSCLSACQIESVEHMLYVLWLLTTEFIDCIMCLSSFQLGNHRKIHLTEVWTYPEIVLAYALLLAVALQWPPQAIGRVFVFLPVREVATCNCISVCQLAFCGILHLKDRGGTFHRLVEHQRTHLRLQEQTQVTWRIQRRW